MGWLVPHATSAGANVAVIVHWETDTLSGAKLHTRGVNTTISSTKFLERKIFNEVTVDSAVLTRPCRFAGNA